jgi:hypothetical protein
VNDKSAPKGALNVVATDTDIVAHTADDSCELCGNSPYEVAYRHVRWCRWCIAAFLEQIARRRDAELRMPPLDVA